MKQVLSLLLALALELALAVPASAAGEDIGIIGGADGPTYILVNADPKAAATVSKEQREQNIKALGGVVGQVNVLLGDRCIAFTSGARWCRCAPHLRRWAQGSITTRPPRPSR